MRTIDNLEAITDGCEYYLSDLVHADPKGCDGCHACCLGVSDYVALNPFDVYQIQKITQQSMELLKLDHFLIKEEQKVPLPYLKTQGEDEPCSFLNDQGRCDVHSGRPDICRLFPLARVYENDGFHYALQLEACVKPQLDEISVESHLQLEHPVEYAAFIWSWYLVVKAFKFRLKFAREADALLEAQELFWSSFFDNPKLSSAPTAEEFFKVYFREIPEIKNSLGIL